MKLLLAGLVGSLLCLFTGCNVIGLGAYAAGGGLKVPPEYKLQKQPTLVLVENYQNPDQYAVPAERIGRNISDELTENKIASFIDASKVYELKSSDAVDFRKMDIPALGRSVGAKQVIYINLVQFSTDPPIADQRRVGKAEARVKVVDTQNGHTLWPLDSSDGRVVRYQTSYSQDVDATQLALIQDQLCQNLSQKIARLFHETPLDEAPESDVR